MPGGKVPSWSMKEEIWDLAGKLGNRPEVILRDLEKLCREGKPFEGEFPPDRRTVSKVINELQILRKEMLATLPRHVWFLRNDYDDIKNDLVRIVSGSFVVEEVVEPEHTKETHIDPTIKHQQMEHIKDLQEVAKLFIDSIPEYPNLNNVDEFKAFYYSLSRLFRGLTGNTCWQNLSAHLNTSIMQIERTSRDLDPFGLTYSKGQFIPRDRQLV